MYRLICEGNGRVVTLDFTTRTEAEAKRKEQAALTRKEISETRRSLRSKWGQQRVWLHAAMQADIERMSRYTYRVERVIA